MTLSATKSVVLHVGNSKKCEELCPKLFVHDKEMKTARSTKYLGDTLTDIGNVKETIETRRSIEWGKINQILATISEIPYGPFRIGIGLQLREAVLVNGMLYN